VSSAGGAHMHTITMLSSNDHTHRISSQGSETRPSNVNMMYIIKATNSSIMTITEDIITSFEEIKATAD
jgi:hypothetical protein